MYVFIYTDKYYVQEKNTMYLKQVWPHRTIAAIFLSFPTQVSLSPVPQEGKREN